MNKLFLLGPVTTDFYAFQVMPGKMNKAWLFFRDLSWYINFEGALTSLQKPNYFFATPIYGNSGIRVMEITEHYLPEIQGKTLGLSLHFEESTPLEAAEAILDWAGSNQISGRSSISQVDGKTIVVLPNLFNFQLEIS